MGVCMMEHSRQARKFFDLAWLGMGAEGAVDAMMACNTHVWGENFDFGLRKCYLNVDHPIFLQAPCGTILFPAARHQNCIRSEATNLIVQLIG